LKVLFPRSAVPQTHKKRLADLRGRVVIDVSAPPGTYIGHFSNNIIG
jgi:hypothetical protein